MTPRRALLHVCRALGLFRVARRLLTGRLLILCYHGVAQADEARWRPKLFMNTETFQARLRYLDRAAIPVVSLAEGLARLGKAGRYAVAITFDDGFQNFAAVAAPMLERHRFPATVYVASYYATHATWPVFDLIVDYAFWRCPDRAVPGQLIAEAEPLLARTPAEREQSVDRVYAYAEREGLDGAAKEALARRLAAALGFEYERHARDGLLCLMPLEELGRLPARGADVQLHTHRHHIPDVDGGLRSELDDNRAALAGAGLPTGVDFCYPSGIWEPAMWAILERAGIRSATTCEAGAAGPATPRYALPRFLDAESVSQIEFEAWASGLMPLVRQLLGRDARPRA